MITLINISYLKKLKVEADEDTSTCYVAINIEVKLNRSKADNTTDVHIVDSAKPGIPKLHVTEEQVLKEYPWDYQTLIDKCKKRHSNFKLNNNFHKIKKTICEEKKEKVCKIRHLDPNNPKSQTKTFYKPEILKEFDKYYTKSDE